jgi:hypothetical protein
MLSKEISGIFRNFSVFTSGNVECTHYEIMAGSRDLGQRYDGWSGFLINEYD